MPRRMGRAAEWRTPVSDWAAAGGRPVPRHLRAVWNLPDGEFCYLQGRLDPGSIAFNVPPATAGRPGALHRPTERPAQNEQA